MLLSILEGGYETSVSHLVEVDFSDEDAVHDLLTVRAVPSKRLAPCILPCTFRGTTPRYTRAGRRRVTDADGGTAILLDIDHGDLDASAVENAVTRLGAAHAIWSTWKAGDPEHGRRWRVLLPLSRPVLPRDYEQAWERVARSFEKNLIAEAGFRPPHGFLDWGSRALTQPAILPCRPAGPARAGEDPWGGVTPKVVVETGVPLLDPGALPTATRAPRRERQPVAGARSPTPYMPDADARGFEVALEQLRLGAHGSVRPIAALDAIARLARDGLPPGLKGGRHKLVSAVIWHLYRLGADGHERDQAVDDIAENSASAIDGKYVVEVGARLIKHYDTLSVASEPVAQRIVEAVKTEVPKAHRGVLLRYARVLARAKHLRREAGGQLDHGALARILGVEVRALVAMRGLIEEAGLLAREGEAQSTRYRLLVEAVEPVHNVAEDEDEEEAA